MASSRTQTRRVSGLFDIRNIIGALMLLYGVALVLVHLFDDSETTGSKDVGAANLWVGLALGALGAFFVVWALLRPVEVPAEEMEELSHDREGEGPDGAEGK